MNLASKVALGALAWLAASVLVGVAVGKALKGSREVLEETDETARRELAAHRASASRDHREARERRARLEVLSADRKAPQDRQGPPSWDRRDRPGLQSKGHPGAKGRPEAQ